MEDSSLELQGSPGHGSGGSGETVNATWCQEQLSNLSGGNRSYDDTCNEFMAGPPLPQTFMYIIQIFYAVICIVGLCGNSLVIYVVLRYSKMQTVTYIYILMLALADEIFLIGIPFLIVTSVQGDWIFGMAMCKIYLTTTSINQFTSSIFLTVLSADRYIAVCHPISAPKYRTSIIARCVSLTAWAASALLMVPVFMYAATITKPQGGQTCNIFWPFNDDNSMINDEGNSTSQSLSQSSDPAEDEVDLDEMRPHVLNGQTAFTFYSFVLGFAIPLLLILSFYVQVIIKLKTVGPKNSKTSKGKKKSHAKVTRLVLTVITVYILCWLPYWITQLALIFTPPGHNQNNVMVAVMLLAGCLSYSNSAMNPILYAFLSENFKKSFMKACTCATMRDANAALNIEPSMLPRRRTLAGMGASARNAAKSRFQQGRDNGRNGGKGVNGSGMAGINGTGCETADATGNGTAVNNERHELRDVSTGPMSRSTRSCAFTSSNCATGVTSAESHVTGGGCSTVNVSTVLSVSTANGVNAITHAGDELPVKAQPVVTTINGNLAPPPQRV